MMNEELTELCETLKPESFKQYCFTLNYHSSLRKMYDMTRRNRAVQRRRHVGDFSWLAEFAEKMVSRTSKLNWLFERFTIEE
jgi:hypothetical protein